MFQNYCKICRKLITNNHFTNETICNVCYYKKCDLKDCENEAENQFESKLFGSGYRCETHEGCWQNLTKKLWDTEKITKEERIDLKKPIVCSISVMSAYLNPLGEECGNPAIWWYYGDDWIASGSCDKHKLEKLDKWKRVIYYKNYYQKNKEKILIKNKKYRQKNKEKYFDYYKKYYEKNKEEYIIARKKYYEKNKTEINLKQKAYRAKNKTKAALYQKAYRAKNKVEIKLNQKAYRAKNKEKVVLYQKIYRAKNKKRRTNND